MDTDQLEHNRRLLVMNMKKNVIALSIAGAMSLPAMANAMQVVGEELEIYMKAHLSLDFDDPDNPAVGSQMSVSSNSSRIGFKGKHQFENGLTGVWQIESKVVFDESGAEFATRNSFAGIQDGFGTIIAGYADTPFKELGGDYTLFGDTVADRRAILGSGVGYSNAFNDRATNMIEYLNKFGPTNVKIMYSASSPNDDLPSAPGIDNNDNALASLSVDYKAGGLALGLAYESQDNATNANPAQKVDGTRIGAMYDFGGFSLGAIYEMMNSDDVAPLDHDSWGINGSVTLGSDMKLQAQVLVADSYTDSTDTGATMTSIGLTKKVDKNLSTYVIYTQTDNQDNANYQGVEDGHGDELKTVNGGKPSAFSLGFVLSI
jgi:predicted porin